MSQGDIPWDDNDFRYMAVTVAGVASALLYLYLRDPGNEITWKDFVHRYLARGLVRTMLICSLVLVFLYSLTVFSSLTLFLFLYRLRVWRSLISSLSESS